MKTGYFVNGFKTDSWKEKPINCIVKKKKNPRLQWPKARCGKRIKQGVSEVAQQVKALVSKSHEPEFYAGNPHSNKREAIPQSCPSEYRAYTPMDMKTKRE